MEENTNFNSVNETAGSAGNEAAQRPAYSAPAAAALQPKKKPSASTIAALVLAFIVVAGAAFRHPSAEERSRT